MMNSSLKSTSVWVWLTLPVALLLFVAAGAGLFVSGLYRDNAYYAAQARGQDLISLAVVLPTLIVTGFLGNRGSSRARVVWLGGLVYLIYTYVVAAFDNKFNSLFLVYVALLGCSLYALTGSLATMDFTETKACFTEKTPARAISIYLAVLAVLFYFLWLSEVVPALLSGAIPQSVQDNGTPTNAIHVLDMAWILPGFLITAVLLWRKQGLGYALAGAALSYIVLLVLAILSMVVFMVLAGQPVVMPQVLIFGTLLAITLGMLTWYLRGVKPLPIHSEQSHL